MSERHPRRSDDEPGLRNDLLYSASKRGAKLYFAVIRTDKKWSITVPYIYLLRFIELRILPVLCFSVSVKRLAVKTDSEMTYSGSNGVAELYPPFAFF